MMNKGTRAGSKVMGMVIRIMCISMRELKIFDFKVCLFVIRNFKHFYFIKFKFLLIFSKIKMCIFSKIQNELI